MNLDDLQREVLDWQEREFRPLSPANPLADALVLAEEAGEVARCVVKKYQTIRGSESHWDEELEKKSGDVIISLLSLAANAGFSLGNAVEKRWKVVGARKFATAEIEESR